MDESGGTLFFMKRLDVHLIAQLLHDGIVFFGGVARCRAGARFSGADVADSGEMRLEFKNRPD